MKVLNLLFILSFVTFVSANVNAQTETQIKNVNTAEFKAMMALENVVVVDVRTAKEVAQGTIENSINIPLNVLSSKMAALPKDKKYLVFCRSGGRSSRAANLMAKQGFQVVNLLGGFRAYAKQ